MANKTSSKLQKIHYQTYKIEGRALKNKIKKLERHCKRFPEDEVNKANLEKAKNGEYKPRGRPLSPGSNQTIPKIKFTTTTPRVKTAGEQLSELLGIPLPKPRKKFKPVIKHKPRRK